MLFSDFKDLKVAKRLSNGRKKPPIRRKTYQKGLHIEKKSSRKAFKKVPQKKKNVAKGPSNSEKPPIRRKT